MTWDATNTKVTKVKNTSNARNRLGCGKIRTLIYCWWECKWHTHFGKQVWKYFVKIVTHFSYDQALPLNRNEIIFSHKEVDVDVHYNITYYCCK